MPENNKVSINGREYVVSPLKIKHLKQITEMLASEPPQGVYAGLERWLPFISDSIKANNPAFTDADLSEATMAEINASWATIVELSGITIVNKTGEKKPIEESTGAASTAA